MFNVTHCIAIHVTRYIVTKKRDINRHIERYIFRDIFRHIATSIHHYIATSLVDRKKNLTKLNAVVPRSDSVQQIQNIKKKQGRE